MELDLERRVYVRMEPVPKAVVRVTNLQSATAREGRADCFARRDFRRGDDAQRPAARRAAKVEVPIDTGLRPDEYELAH